ncbi:hypothetical protein NC651_035206 [Populus alba x Populus x berolinensis]|nr:hypothetical protein NC651_035206 [Populus alba x Populus x berolinensis]
MASPAKIMMRAFLSHYKDGLDNIKSSVDVADGIRGHQLYWNGIDTKVRMDTGQVTSTLSFMNYENIGEKVQQ